jgi:hypothetical protein
VTQVDNSVRLCRLLRDSLWLLINLCETLWTLWLLINSERLWETWLLINSERLWETLQDCWQSCETLCDCWQLCETLWDCWQLCETLTLCDCWQLCETLRELCETLCDCWLTQLCETLRKFLYKTAWANSVRLWKWPPQADNSVRLPWDCWLTLWDSQRLCETQGLTETPWDLKVRLVRPLLTCETLCDSVWLLINSVRLCETVDWLLINSETLCVTVWLLTTLWDSVTLWDQAIVLWETLRTLCDCWLTPETLWLLINSVRLWETLCDQDNSVRLCDSVRLCVTKWQPWDPKLLWLWLTLWDSCETLWMWPQAD